MRRCCWWTMAVSWRENLRELKAHQSKQKMLDCKLSSMGCITSHFEWELLFLKLVSLKNIARLKNCPDIYIIMIRIMDHDSWPLVMSWLWVLSRFGSKAWLPRASSNLKTLSFQEFIPDHRVNICEMSQMRDKRPTEQPKIELLSQRKLEDESRKIVLYGVVKMYTLTKFWPTKYFWQTK